MRRRSKKADPYEQRVRQRAALLGVDWIADCPFWIVGRGKLEEVRGRAVRILKKMRIEGERLVPTSQERSKILELLDKGHESELGWEQPPRLYFVYELEGEAAEMVVPPRVANQLREDEEVEKAWQFREVPTLQQVWKMGLTVPEILDGIAIAMSEEPELVKAMRSPSLIGVALVTEGSPMKDYVEGEQLHATDLLRLILLATADGMGGTRRVRGRGKAVVMDDIDTEHSGVTPKRLRDVARAVLGE